MHCDTLKHLFHISTTICNMGAISCGEQLCHCVSTQTETADIDFTSNVKRTLKVNMKLSEYLRTRKTIFSSNSSVLQLQL